MTEPMRRKILIIDDQPTLARAIRRMLSEHDVTVVSSGREALDLIEAGQRYDVILSDLMMPEVSGIDVYKRLAATAPEQLSKVVFMTGGAFTHQAKEFFDQIANPTIEKPFDRAALFAAIETLLR